MDDDRGMLALAGCSGGETGGKTYDDTATATRLAGLGLTGSQAPADRASSLAQCSAVLTSHVGQTPPPDRADRLRTLAGRLQQAAVKLGEQNGKTAADINGVRDEAIAAQGHFAAEKASAYKIVMEAAVSKCSLAEVLTDDELAGRGALAPAAGALGPMPGMTNDSMTAPPGN